MARSSGSNGFRQARRHNESHVFRSPRRPCLTTPRPKPHVSYTAAQLPTTWLSFAPAAALDGAWTQECPPRPLEAPVVAMPPSTTASLHCNRLCFLSSWCYSSAGWLCFLAPPKHQTVVPPRRKDDDRHKHPSPSLDVSSSPDSACLVLSCLVSLSPVCTRRPCARPVRPSTSVRLHPRYHHRPPRRANHAHASHSPPPPRGGRQRTSPLSPHRSSRSTAHHARATVPGPVGIRAPSTHVACSYDTRSY